MTLTSSTPISTLIFSGYAVLLVDGLSLVPATQPVVIVGRSWSVGAGITRHTQTIGVKALVEC